MHPVREGFNGLVSIIRLSIDGHDVGGLISLSSCQHFDFSFSSFLDPDGDHIISSTGRDSVSDIALVVYIPLRDGDVLSLLMANLASETHNQLVQVAVLLL